MRPHFSRAGWAYRLAAITCLTAWAGLASAQAWVPAAGQGSLGVGYQYTIIHNHPSTGYAGGPGNRFYIGDIVGLSAELSADYGLLPHVAVSANAAYVSARYNGLAAEGMNDDGKFHSDLQDLDMSVRYMLRWNQFAITPIIGAQVPLKDYSSFGHAAIGRGLHQYPVGISAGTSLSPWLPEAFLQAGYSRVFVQDVDEFDLDRDRYALDAGYFVTPALSVRGFFAYSEAMDGVDWARDLSTPAGAAEHFGHHDVAAQELVRRAGGSVSYRLNDRVGLSLGYEGTLSGANTHSGQGVTFGTNWSFSTRSLLAR